MPKSSAPMEVIQDSEDEQPKSSKKKNSEDGKSQSGDEEAAEGSQPEEYEIEAILDAKHGAFPGGRMGFLVKWKGYDQEHNSWVDQADAGNAQDLIDTFWENRKKNKKVKPKQFKGRPRKSETEDGSPVIDEPPSTNKRKKNASGRKSKSSQPDNDEEMDEDEEDKPRVKKAKKIPRAKQSEEMDVDEEAEEPEYKPMEKYRSQKSWESLVAQVDTIEKIEGTLKVFFTLNNGDKVVETSHECAKHFPQKLIQFYESNLRWRESD